MSDEKRPEISVIVPVYNNEKYITRCVDSITTQSFTDYEILLIDDGSQDQSGAICDEIANSRKNVYVIHQENKGLATSRKVGIQSAKGRYITFIDSDDYVAQDMFRVLYENIEDFDIISCCFIIVKEEKEIIRETFAEHHIDFFDNKDMIKAFFDKKYLNGSACGMLVRKELYDEIDMCEGAVPGEEICTSLQLYQIAKSVRAIPQPLYYYWQNDTGISHGGYTNRHRKGLENYIKVCNQLVGKYPDMYDKICSYFCEYEMAIMTAMCRNDTYDEAVIRILQNQLSKYMKPLWRNNYTKLYFKISALLIVINYRLFAVIFKIIRKYVGR